MHPIMVHTQSPEGINIVSLSWLLISFSWLLPRVCESLACIIETFHYMHVTESLTSTTPLLFAWC
ncbi:hypothetical protein KC19_7G123200 [Ceratodon purpureus]|uniref:Uncharacterized protein n=1 Tax=Ceratodon purpureus TaxID=3225 RepID=A0A8T0H9A2_CERPU|nr:hypothetical protein KC19_7G123200 [Ceratodon purpureus]